MRESISKYIKEFSKELSDAVNIVLVCHINPDGDAIGSMLGLFHYLRSVNKPVTMVSPNSIQDFLLWMEGADQIIIFESEPGHAIKHIRDADLVIYLDFNDPSRIERIATVVSESGSRVIMIDHHPGPTIKADLVISEPAMSSTAELVYELVTGVRGSRFEDRDFVESLFVGMMTDTGNFNFGTFDGDTLRTVAFMLDSGLRKDYITDRVYNNFSSNRMKLMGYSLAEKMVVMPSYHTAYIYLSIADLDRFKHNTGDTEGFVNLPLSVDGIIFSVLFIEKEDHVKLSLRSKGDFPVNIFSELHFSGGGHRNAAGGRHPFGLEECLAYFESLLPEYRDKLEKSFRKGLK